MPVPLSIPLTVRLIIKVDAVHQRLCDWWKYLPPWLCAEGIRNRFFLIWMPVSLCFQGRLLVCSHEKDKLWKWLSVCVRSEEALGGQWNGSKQSPPSRLWLKSQKTNKNKTPNNNTTKQNSNKKSLALKYLRSIVCVLIIKDLQSREVG